MNKYLLIIIAFLFVGYQSAFAQGKITVKGTVTDAASKEKLIGVSVRVKGKSVGTATDANGAFSIVAQANDVLEVSYTGYKTATIAVGGNTHVDVKLESDVAQLNEVVLIGTRSSGRAKLETPVPVDVVNVAKASTTTGRLDLTDILIMPHLHLTTTNNRDLTVPTTWSWEP
jgi:iron complex outermembrane receptor protein